MRFTAICSINFASPRTGAGRSACCEFDTVTGGLVDVEHEHVRGDAVEIAWLTPFEPGMTACQCEQCVDEPVLLLAGSEHALVGVA